MQGLKHNLSIRTFENLNDNQYSGKHFYDPGYKDNRECGKTNESSDWRKNQRINCFDDSVCEIYGNKKNTAQKTGLILKSRKTIH